MSQTHHDLIMGTSISKTFYWHIGSYYNWGEPWNGGFTESMQQYRIDNQALFDRNEMPHMLGWYLLSESTTLADMEWMLARSAGYGAGFAMVARPRALRNNPLTPVLLDAIREWERARNSHAFTAAQRDRLKDPKQEFHLRTISDGEWELSQIAQSPVFTHSTAERQPGEPTASRFTVEQTWDAQPLQVRVTQRSTAVASDTSVVIPQIVLTLDGVTRVVLPVALRAGESLFADGTTVLRVFDSKGKATRRITLSAPLPSTARGSHTVSVEALAAAGAAAPLLDVQLRGLANTESVRRPPTAPR
jgi:hypothetical protein